jgi:hypothetical protein
MTVFLRYVGFESLSPKDSNTVRRLAAIVAYVSAAALATGSRGGGSTTVVSVVRALKREIASTILAKSLLAIGDSCV